MKFAPTGLALLLAFASAACAAQNIVNGERVFRTICSSCHGPAPGIGGPETAANDPAKISAAINGKVSSMAFLRGVVSNQDIQDVAAYLGTFTAPVPPPSTVPAFDYTDLWWSPIESGWGLNLIQHPTHVIFGVVYTYDTNRKPMWLVIPGGTWASSTLFSGPIYRVTGPLPTLPWDASKVNVRQVGTATLTFTDRDNGTLNFSVDGVQVTKSISRQPF